MRKALVLIALGVFFISPAPAQVFGTIQTGSSCSYFGEVAPASVVTFQSDTEAEDVIRRIVSASGLAKNFQVNAAGVPNAAAVIQGSQRLILYNPRFMSDTRTQAKNNAWAATSIMAHEVGHHLNGHTLVPGGSRPPTELEADYFSGFVLQKMGATLRDAQVAMEVLGSASGSSTHPAKHDRLAAIASGWGNACDQSPGCRTSAPAPTPAPTPTPTSTPRPRPEPNSCEYAHDDICDEPDVCDAGTDTSDCKPSRPTPRPTPRTPPPQPAVASACYTPLGSCAMAMAVPQGAPCYCPTFNGPVWGRAQ